jgi:hypothetical protein
MARQQKTPLRALTETERAILQRIARSGRERADRVPRAKALLGVAEGTPFTEAAAAVGVRTGDTVARWVARCNFAHRSHSPVAFRHHSDAAAPANVTMGGNR